MIKYEFTRHAERQLHHLPLHIQRLIVQKIKQFCQAQSLVKVEMIKRGQAKAYRLRVGNYRVILDWEENMIVVLKVGHRKDIYRNL